MDRYTTNNIRILGLTVYINKNKDKVVDNLVDKLVYIPRVSVETRRYEKTISILLESLRFVIQLATLACPQWTISRAVRISKRKSTCEHCDADTGTSKLKRAKRMVCIARMIMVASNVFTACWRMGVKCSQTHNRWKRDRRSLVRVAELQSCHLVDGQSAVSPAFGYAILDEWVDGWVHQRATVASCAMCKWCCAGQFQSPTRRTERVRAQQQKEMIKRPSDMI